MFNVELVEPVEVRKKPVLPKKRPLLRKTRRRPVIIKPAHPAPEKKPPPETMYGKAPEPPRGDNEDSTGSPEPPPPHNAPLSSLFDKKTIEKFARKGEPRGKGLSFNTSEFRNRGYMRRLKKRIEDAWKYPVEAARLGISGDLYMKFSIKKDGTLGEIKLLRTSGYRDLDEAAIKALRDAGPFWPLPEDWEKDSLEIKGHFIYIFGSTYIM